MPHAVNQNKRDEQHYDPVCGGMTKGENHQADETRKRDTSKRQCHASELELYSGSAQRRMDGPEPS